MWIKVTRKKDMFIKKYDSFLNRYFEVRFDSENFDLKNDILVKSDTPMLTKGRPKVSYNEGSIKSKRRRSEELASAHCEEELSRAIKIKNVDSAKNLQIEEQELEGLENCNPKINNVLAMYIDLQLTKRKYEKLRKHSKIINPNNNAYSPYSEVLKCKSECYPGNISVQDIGASAAR